MVPGQCTYIGVRACNGSVCSGGGVTGEAMQ